MWGHRNQPSTGDHDNGSTSGKGVDDENLTHQLPFPPPFFLVLLGSSFAWPDLAKYRGRCSSA